MKLGDDAKITAPDRQLTNLQKRLKSSTGIIKSLGLKTAVIEYQDGATTRTIQIDQNMVQTLE